MTLKARRIIYIIFILIFLLAAPVILLYTAGYNYNFKRGSFLKTGVLMIDALPPSAHFSINGKLYTDSLPARVSNLKPNDYRVLVLKEGYHSWQKTLTVGSGETIFATTVFLLKQSAPQKIFDSSVEQSLFLKKSNQFILVIIESGVKKIILFDVSTSKKIILPIALSNSIERMTLSPNEKYLSLETDKQSWAFNLNKPTAKPTLLEGRFGPLRQITFQENDDLSAYAKDGQLVIRFNLITDEQHDIYNIGQGNFLITDGFLYWTAAIPRQTFALRRISLFNNDGQKPATIFNPPRGNYHLSLAGGNILLHEQQTKLFYLINPETRALAQSGELKNSQLGANNLWLYYNDSEIWLKNFNNPGVELITRVGTKIIKAASLPAAPYVLYATPESLILIEEDNRDIKNIYTLLNLSGITDFFLKDETTVYVFGKDGLYSLDLQ